MGSPPILSASQGPRMTVLFHSMEPMRLPTYWGLGIGLLLLCSLVALPPRLGAEDISPERLIMEALCQAIPSRCPTTAELPPLAALLLQLAVSAPPEDPLVSDCQYLGVQTEWVAAKRDAGLSLGEVWHASQRVFAPDLPWHDALAGALGTLVYRAPQRSPAELRQAMEAACLGQPPHGVGHHADG
jgi:hypothetical protein